MGPGEIGTFFTKYCEKLKLTLKHPIKKALKELAIAIKEEITRCKPARGIQHPFLSHLYTNLLSCIVTPVERAFIHWDLNSDG